MPLNPSMPTLDVPGASLHYHRVGQGPAVLLIQGVGIIGAGWEPQVDALSDRFTLVTFDNRGIGGSLITDGELTIEAMAEDALAILRAERLDHFHVVGHSMGGLIAQEVALRAREKVRSLALLCTFAFGRQGATPSLAVLGLALRTRIGTARMRRRAFLEFVLPASLLDGTDRDALAAQLAPLFGHDLADQPPVVKHQLRAMLRYDARPRLAELADIPTLVVVAQQDRVARERHGRSLAAAIPGARLVVLPDAAHGVPLHDPATINALLREHMLGADAERLPQAGAGAR